MQQSILAALKAEFPGLSIRENVPWREVTSLKAGGVIPVLAEPGDDIVLAPLLYFCHSRHIPVLVLGNGSNTVGADALPETLVLRLNHGNFVRICFARDRIVAGAGVRWKDFVRTCAEHGFGGLAPLAGIPGQVGGLLMMNAGAHGAAISDFLYEVCGFDQTGESCSMMKDDLRWEYRHTSIPAGTVVTAAIFKLPPAAPDEQERITGELRNRGISQPGGLNAGCFFRNAGNESAGKLIDEAGCKGLSVGDATVSDLHANFILNRGNATEKDILELMIQVRRKVAEHAGIYLKPEVCFADSEALKKFYMAVPPPRIALSPDSPLRTILRNIGYEIATAEEEADLIVAEFPVTPLNEHSCGLWLKKMIAAKK